MLIKGGSSVSDRLLALLNTDTYDAYPPAVTARTACNGVAHLGSPGSLFDKYARISRPRPSAAEHARRRPNS
ncbi:hypothetical protein X777_00841 [Ooceraea biroi]|uniref:Uncharacterized protein n=1 Tax=Ooceraea biroi TaxID=2015173 RepID=A0A026WPY8_OOCBI|nr:hypothetical protein X777_00841 [Ooceraea biroi]